MTTIDLYRKHKAGDISREKFLYEVRRDNNLPWITNITSYDDAVKILKNKGIVTEGQTKEAKADEAVKAEVKAKKPSEKKLKELHIDHANPYEYRHGIAHELNQLDDYSADALEKAKTTVLKNLAKDANFYSNLLNQQQSSFEFKQTETDAKGMQARSDGHMKKEAKKDEKANVKDNLGKKEAGKTKPKGVKVMPDKGVEGKEKTIKEGVDDKVEDMIKSGKIKPEEVKAAAEKAMKGDSSELAALMAGFKLAEDTVEEGSFMGGVDLGGSFEKMKSSMGDEAKFEDLMKKYDWYAEMSDDTRKWDAQQDMERELKMLAQSIGADKAAEIWNRNAPEDRKVQSSYFMRESKLAKIKEALKNSLKKEVKTAKSRTDQQFNQSIRNTIDREISDSSARAAIRKDFESGKAVDIPSSGTTTSR